MKCPECGKELNAGARFCTGCGAQALGPDAAHGPGSGRGVPAPPPPQAPAPGAPHPPAAAEHGSEESQPPVFTAQHAEKPAPLWQRMPQRARLGLTLAAAVCVAVALFFSIHFYMNGGSSLTRVSGVFMRPGTGFSLELPGNKWFTPSRPTGDVDEPGVFYRGRGPHAPVTLSVYHLKARTAMPMQLEEQHASLLKDYFVKHAERLLVRDGLGFEPSEPEILTGMGPRHGMLLTGKALPAQSAAYPVYIVFAYDYHDEYVLVFLAPGKDPAQYEKEIMNIAKSFRIE